MLKVIGHKVLVWGKRGFSGCYFLPKVYLPNASCIFVVIALPQFPHCFVFRFINIPTTIRHRRFIPVGATLAVALLHSLCGLFISFCWYVSFWAFVSIGRSCYVGGSCQCGRLYQFGRSCYFDGPGQCGRLYQSGHSC